MRRKAKTDANQAEIVRALKEAGCGVIDLSAVGKGIPDLLVHPPTFPECRMAVLMEVKNKKGRGDKLTAAQEKFHAEWKGWIFRVTSVDEAIKAVIPRAYPSLHSDDGA